MPLIKITNQHLQSIKFLEDRKELHPVRTAVAEIASLLFIFVATPLIVFFDTSVVGDPMSENTLTERLQIALIVISTAVFAVGTLWHAHLRGYLGAVTVLLACMTIRENDHLLDNVYHGFWLLPALIVLGVGSVFVWKHRLGVSAAFAAHLNSHSGAFFSLGLLLLLVFSRLFGTGDLWEGIMGSAYTPIVKTAVQEGLELLGYFLIAYGSFVSLREGFGDGLAQSR